MLKLLQILLLVGLAYAGWFYLSELTVGPVRHQVFYQPAEAVEHILVGNKQTSFRLDRGDGDGRARWVVSQNQRLLYGQDARVERFLRELNTTLSDSAVAQVPRRKPYDWMGVSLRGRAMREDYTFYFYRSPGEAVFVNHENTSETFALPPRANRWLTDYLRFDAYREPRLLDLAAQDVDSILVLREDSIAWGITTGDLRVAAQRFIAPADAPYADYFDEIAHRDREYGRIELYAGEEVKRIRVFRDSLWPQAYVLVGEDYPRRFLGYAALR